MDKIDEFLSFSHSQLDIQISFGYLDIHFLVSDKIFDDDKLNSLSKEKIKSQELLWKR